MKHPWQKPKIAHDVDHYIQNRKTNTIHLPHKENHRKPACGISLRRDTYGNGNEYTWKVIGERMKEWYDEELLCAYCFKGGESP